MPTTVTPPVSPSAATKQALPTAITYTTVATQYVLNSVSPNLTAGTLVGNMTLFDAAGKVVKNVSVSVPFSATDTIAAKLTALLAAIPTT